jgi:hypothetical protein
MRVPVSAASATCIFTTHENHVMDDTIFVYDQSMHAHPFGWQEGPWWYICLGLGISNVELETATVVNT